jgi:hypothetical protein
MIKNFIKKSLIIAALITLSVYTISAIWSGHWDDTYFIWELFILSGLICIVQLLLNRFKSDYYLLEILVEYFVVILIVGAAGLVYGWFRLQYLWQVFAYVTPVYVVGYLLDLARTRRELDFINDKIKKRSKGGVGNEEDDDNC